MKAIVHCEYGGPDVLTLRDVEKPAPNDNQVLVRVRAASVNPLDLTIRGLWLLRPISGMRKPKDTRLGVDYAGTVEEVGKNVTQFKPGDEVFGGRSGALAEYVCVLSDRAVVLKPAKVTFEQAAAVPVAAITALQGLRDKGHIQAGQKVLINGASGGVGTFAVQIAKSFGAEVTAVCSTRNVDIVRSLGADHVVDYTHDDFTRSDQRYDLMLDIAGSRSWSECKRVLNPHATLVVVGAPKGNRLLGPVRHLAKVGLVVVQELLEAGKVTPSIDRRYELSDVADALRYLEEGHARGKIVITV